MSMRALLGNSTKMVTKRHGKLGYVRLGCDIPETMKTDLVLLAEKNDVNVSDIVRDAIDFYFDSLPNEVAA